MRKKILQLLCLLILILSLAAFASGICIYKTLVIEKIELPNYLFQASVISLLFSSIGFILGLYYVVLKISDEKMK
jgi:hypothetical protein